MEVYREGIYWYIKNSHGPVPSKLQGMWQTKETADKAIDLYRSQLHSKVINVTERNRKKKERASSNTEISA